MLIDWDLATAGTPTVEFAWYLAHSARRIDADARRDRGRPPRRQGGELADDEVELGMLSGLVQYGWRIAHSARVHPDPAETAWGRESSAGGCRACAARSSGRRPGRSAMTEAFRHTDAARTIVFGAGALDAAADLIGDGYTLLTTARAAGSAPVVAERAAAVVHVPGGLVEVVAAALRPDVTGRRLVALGGGRVIDVAKALAAADGPREVLAIPTSLSAAEMTRVHRHAEGVPGDTPRVRPGVVVNDPALSASLPEDALAAGSAYALSRTPPSACWSYCATPASAARRVGRDGALRGRLAPDRARPSRRSPWARCSPAGRSTSRRPGA